MTTNNLNSIKFRTYYGQTYEYIKTFPLYARFHVKTTDSGKKRYLIINPAVVAAWEYRTYAMFNPQFWVDRSSAYENDANGADCIDFGFNIQNYAETQGIVEYLDVAGEIEVYTDYFQKLKMLIDEIMEFPMIAGETPLLISAYDEPNSQYLLEFISTSRAAADYYVYFYATIMELKIYPSDLVTLTGL